MLLPLVCLNRRSFCFCFHRCCCMLQHQFQTLTASDLVPIAAVAPIPLLKDATPMVLCQAKPQTAAIKSDDDTMPESESLGIVPDGLIPACAPESTFSDAASAEISERREVANPQSNPMVPLKSLGFAGFLPANGALDPPTKVPEAHEPPKTPPEAPTFKPILPETEPISEAEEFDDDDDGLSQPASFSLLTCPTQVTSEPASERPTSLNPGLSDRQGPENVPENSGPSSFVGRLSDTAHATLDEIQRRRSTLPNTEFKSFWYQREFSSSLRPSCRDFGRGGNHLQWARCDWTEKEQGIYGMLVAYVYVERKLLMFNSKRNFGNS